MIVILCENDWEAHDKFDLFMQVLQDNEGDSITRVWPECCCVETDSDLKYMFVDYRMEPIFEARGCDIIDEDDFLYGLDEMYELVEKARF